MKIKKFIRKILNLKISCQRIFYTYWVKKRAFQTGLGLKVNGRSQVTHQTYIGNNVHFNGMKILGKGTVKIGDNFHSGFECIIMTEYHNYDHGKEIPYDDTYIIENVVIEDNVWLGNRVIILSGVTIGEGAIFQAGSVVVRDIPKLAIAGGHPAKVFKYRNEHHYTELKTKGKFH